MQLMTMTDRNCSSNAPERADSGTSTVVDTAHNSTAARAMLWLEGELEAGVELDNRTCDIHLAGEPAGTTVSHAKARRPAGARTRGLVSADAGAAGSGEVHARPRALGVESVQVRRAGWDSLMARLESGATGGVVVFDIERFSRQALEGERLIAAAERGLRVLDSDAEYGPCLAVRA